MDFTPPKLSERTLTAVARIGVVLCVWVMATGNSPPADEALRLFTTFKVLCIDTDARPNAVEAGVVANGGQIRWPKTAVLGGWSKSWKLVVGGRDLKVFSGAKYFAAYEGWPAYEIDSCGVRSSNTEGPSVAAAGAWVGVPPNRHTESQVIYAYKQFGSRRVRASFWTARKAADPDHPDKATFIRAIVVGNYYMLEIFRYEGTLLSLERYHLSDAD